MSQMQVTPDLNAAFQALSTELAAAHQRLAIAAGTISALLAAVKARDEKIAELEREKASAPVKGSAKGEGKPLNS